ncbi:unnamed protein product, partial [Oikopleura dioica]
LLPHLTVGGFLILHLSIDNSRNLFSLLSTSSLLACQLAPRHSRSACRTACQTAARHPQCQLRRQGYLRQRRRLLAWSRLRKLRAWGRLAVRLRSLLPCRTAAQIPAQILSTSRLLLSTSKLRLLAWGRLRKLRLLARGRLRGTRGRLAVRLLGTRCRLAVRLRQRRLLLSTSKRSLLLSTSSLLPSKIPAEIQMLVTISFRKDKFVKRG